MFLLPLEKLARYNNPLGEKKKRGKKKGILSNSGSLVTVSDGIVIIIASRVHYHFSLNNIKSYHWVMYT